MSCVARPHQTPIGAASNFLQRKWVSCSKSYWQGYECYDLAWYKDIWRPLVFRSPIYGWRDVHQGRGQLSESLLSYPPSDYELEKTFHSIAGGKRGRSCRCSGCAVCCVCSVLFRLALSRAVLPFAPSCEMVRDGAGKQQQASSSRQAAAGKQQQQAASSKQQAASSNQRLPPWKNEQIQLSFKNQRDTKNWTFSRRTASRYDF